MPAFKHHLRFDNAVSTTSRGLRAVLVKTEGAASTDDGIVSIIDDTAMVGYDHSDVARLTPRFILPSHVQKVLIVT